MSADASRRIYLGMDNLLSVVINNCKCDKVKLEADQGKLQKDGNCRYIYRADTVGTVRFKVSETGSDKINATFFYKVYDAPDLTVYLGWTYTGGLIRKEEFLKEHELNCTIDVESTFSGVVISIDSFSFMIVRDTTVIFQEKNHSNKITSAEKEAISKTEPGDKILIFNLIASINKRIQRLKPAEFTIRD